MSQVAEILEWFQLAIPDPDAQNRATQIGCHIEEVAEMMDALADQDSAEEFRITSDHWKNFEDPEWITTHAVNELELLDALADQIVTAIGVAHMFGFDIEGALKEVNRSNFSKFVDGKPVFNEQGKIAKPPTYSPPDLTPYLGSE